MPISALNVRESLDSRVVYEIGIKEHDDEVRFKTVSRHKADLCMRIEKYAI